MVKHKISEEAFEASIVAHLVQQGGYEEGQSNNYHPETALDEALLIRFLKTTQAEAWAKLEKIHGAEAVEQKVIRRLCAELGKKDKGMLAVLRSGIKDRGVGLRLMYAKPNSTINRQSWEHYRANILSVTRQVHYSAKDRRRSLDLVFFVNGLPVATAELKNQFTGQDSRSSILQYTKTRNEKEPLFRFKQRALVHFALDADEVYLTTRLAGDETYFLPFNRGWNQGAGNPPQRGKHKTAYMWEDIWERESWLDILEHFIHLEGEKLIFPRFHQLEVVRNLVAQVQAQGVGRNYLIQHSAGSGKSNSIAWLAYRLLLLHNKENEPFFSAVLVITDRKVLDKQLQRKISQLERRKGRVQNIDENAAQLYEALQDGGKIIVTTLQKFPFVTLLEQFEQLGQGRKYAVIVDEAHSSQGGEASTEMKKILGAQANEEETDAVHFDRALLEMHRQAAARQQQDNLSFFAFTATPKAKTLEIFGRKLQDGKAVPFHLYAMKQAIEEGFILDVLQNYRTYASFYKLSHSLDKEVPNKMATKAIRHFMSSHPHVIRQKTEIMIDHFRTMTSRKLNGQAKAMVVTSSRLQAVLYYQAIKSYIQEKGYLNIRPLVAFSGTVVDPSDPEKTEYREAQLNGFGEKALPRMFASADYRLLVVANKYQTGFDQPLLHTMYVDKPLSGVAAVQTLSRLNRTAKGKEDTFILDFVNTPEAILAAFQPYYTSTTLSEEFDPNLIYDIKTAIEDFGIIYEEELENFCRLFFDRENYTSAIENQTHAQLHASIDPAVNRFGQLEQDQQLELKKSMTAYMRQYTLIAQVLPYPDVDLEKFYAYLRYLSKKLPKGSLRQVLQLGNAVALDYFRLEKTQGEQVVLEPEEPYGLKPPTEVGIKRIDSKEDMTSLAAIVQRFNDRHAIAFEEADRVALESVIEDCRQNTSLVEQARANKIQDFKLVFDKKIDGFLFAAQMKGNEKLFSIILGDKELKKLVKEWLRKHAYERFRAEEEES